MQFNTKTVLVLFAIVTAGTIAGLVLNEWRHKARMLAPAKKKDDTSTASSTLK